MNRRYWLLLLCIVIALGALYLYIQAKPKSNPVNVTPKAVASSASAVPASSASPSRQTPKGITNQLISAEREREAKMWQSWVATPILFYGKVVDEKGNSIPDATVLVSFGDALGTGEDSKVTEKTDSSGLFVANGHGIAIVIMVSKEGYYKQRTSDGTFGYVQGSNFAPHTDPSDPAIFKLRKMGQVDSLIVTSIGGKIGKDGTPFKVDLKSAKKVDTGEGDLKIQCWTNDAGVQVNSNELFDWRCRISVDGGGLIERRGEFDFEAPETGYRPFVEIDMPKTLGNSWRDSITKDLFFRLANGTYGRIQVMLNAGGEQTFYLNGYLNPKLGSRNLEFGPTEN